MNNSKYILSSKETILGILNKTGERDSWHCGTFEASESFEAVRHLFNIQNHYADNDDFDDPMFEEVSFKIDDLELKIISFTDSALSMEVAITFEGKLAEWHEIE
jgi:hypothetical protein